MAVEPIVPQRRAPREFSSWPWAEEYQGATTEPPKVFFDTRAQSRGRHLKPITVADLSLTG